MTTAAPHAFESSRLKIRVSFTCCVYMHRQRMDTDSVQIQSPCRVTRISTFTSHLLFQFIRLRYKRCSQMSISVAASSFHVSHSRCLSPRGNFACRVACIVYPPFADKPSHRRKFHPLWLLYFPQKKRKVSPDCVLSACPRGKSSRPSYNFTARESIRNRSILIVVEKDLAALRERRRELGVTRVFVRASRPRREREVATSSSVVRVC